MWSDWLVVCDFGCRLSALWCPLSAPTVFPGFLFPLTWGISSWLLQQSAAAAPYLGRGVSPHCCPSWPWMWSSSSRPSCTHVALLLGHVVAYVPMGRFYQVPKSVLSSLHSSELGLSVPILYLRTWELEKWKKLPDLVNLTCHCPRLKVRSVWN